MAHMDSPLTTLFESTELIGVLVQICDRSSNRVPSCELALAVWHNLVLCNAGVLLCLHHPSALPTLGEMVSGRLVAGDHVRQLAGNILHELARTEKVGKAAHARNGSESCEQLLSVTSAREAT